MCVMAVSIMGALVEALVLAALAFRHLRLRPSLRLCCARSHRF